MLVDSVSIDHNQIIINETTTQASKQLLVHCDTHPNSAICYKKSYMVILIHCDITYLLESHADIQDKVRFFLWSQNIDSSDNNGAILTILLVI